MPQNGMLPENLEAEAALAQGLERVSILLFLYSGLFEIILESRVFAGEVDRQTTF